MSNSQEPKPSEADVAAAAAVAKKGEKVEKKEDKPVELVIGETVRLSAVHGQIIHPFTTQSFDTDASSKVEVDSWIQIQFNAGKLKIED